MAVWAAGRWIPARLAYALLVGALVMLSGCAAKPALGDNNVANDALPLPPPLHDERDVLASASFNQNFVDTACSATRPCAEYRFVLPRAAILGANLSWKSSSNAIAVEVLQGGDPVSYKTPALGALTVAVQQELQEGPASLRVFPFRMANDRYILDVVFTELPSPAAPYQPSLPGVDPYDAIRASMADVPCQAPYTALDTTENLRRLNLNTFDAALAGPREMDLQGDLLLASRLDGFTAVDVSDPANPAVLEHYGGALGDMRDIKFSPDNQTAILAAHASIHLVDIRDPNNPTKVGAFSFADAPIPQQFAAFHGNMHMVVPARIADQDWVFLATQSSTGVWVLKLEGAPEARTLTYVTATMPVQGGPPFAPHDIFVQYDQDRQDWLLYSADGYTGWAVFDVSDPTTPALIANVPSGEVATHSVQAAKIGERRIVATSTEGGNNAIKIYDATDLQSPVLVGIWTRQIGPEIEEAQHNLQIVDGRLYLAHYANGLFVFDLTRLDSAAGALDLQPIAHYMGSHTSPLGASTTAGFWDIILRDGVVYSGVHSGGDEVGLHVIGFGCIMPGDAIQTSTA